MNDSVWNVFTTWHPALWGISASILPYLSTSRGVIKGIFNIDRTYHSTVVKQVHLAHTSRRPFTIRRSSGGNAVFLPTTSIDTKELEVLVLDKPCHAT